MACETGKLAMAFVILRIGLKSFVKSVVLLSIASLDLVFDDLLLLTFDGTFCFIVVSTYFRKFKVIGSARSTIYCAKANDRPEKQLEHGLIKFSIPRD